MKAAQLWAPGKATGLGVGVAVVDTGVTDGPDFAATNGGPSRIVARQIFNSNTSTTSDGFGHGSHVAGIIAGNSWWSGVDTGAYLGVAPQANLIELKVADDTGQAYESDVINGIMWAIANRQLYNIRVMNLSLQSTVSESYQQDALDAAVELAWFNGILVVVAAGNGGPSSEVFAPANDPFVVTVGAADMVGTPGQRDDTVISWSSYGITQDGFSKPDLVAPGRALTSVLAPGSVLGQQNDARIVDDHYLTLSGTSMSSAVVAGVAALIFQAQPSWTNDQAKWALEQTATSLHGAIGQGAGEVNAQAAAKGKGTPGFANQELAISPLLLGPGGAIIYQNQTPNELPWSWTTSSWTTSSWTTSSWTRLSTP